MGRLFLLAAVTGAGVLGGALQSTYETIRADMSWEGPEGRVDLEGVCKFSETEVSCWGPRGTDDAELAQKVKKALSGTYQSVQLRFGMKNRIVVVKTSVPAAPLAGGLLNEYFNATAGSFELGQSESNGSTRTTTRAYVVAVDQSVKSHELSTSITRPLPSSKRVPLSVGSKLEFGDASYEVVKVDVMKGGQANGDTLSRRWVVILKASVGRKTRVSPTFYALNTDEVVVSWVDKLGKPVYIDPNEWSRRGYGFPPNSDYRQAEFGYSGYMPGMGAAGAGQPSDRLVLTTNIDPKHVKWIVASGADMQTLTITGIPLDPGSGN